jgi:hypothetical protein
MIRRLVQHSSPDGRETPLLLLGALREIDPTVELAHFGGRDWRLGSVKSGQSLAWRAEKAAQMIDSLDRAKAAGHRINYKNYLLANLLRQGFAMIAQYFDFGDPSGTVQDSDGNHTTIVEDFRERDFHYRRDQGEAVVREATAEAGGRSRDRESDRKFADYMHADGRDHYNREMRGRVQFGVGGMTGGSGRLVGPGALSAHRPIITGEEAAHELMQIMAELGGE